MSNVNDYQPTTEDWTEYAEYLDEIGYDLEDDADYGDEDEFEGRGYQPLTFDIPADEDEDDILAEFGF